jgi:hypothetical protein
MLLALVGAVDTVWILATPLRLDPAGLAADLCIAGAFLLISVAGARILPARALQLGAGISFMLFAWPALRLFNHLVMTLPFPLTDALLAHWDSDLGLHWPAYVFWVDAHPYVADAMRHAYTSLTLFSCGVFAALVAFRDMRAAHDFLALFLLSAIAASVAGCFFPAHTAMAFYAPIQQTLHHIDPDYGVSFAPFLDEIRTNPAHILQLQNLPGLTAFPSFHTAMALIAIYCARTRRLLFAVSLPFNTLVIAAAPVFGGHYFCDIVAGGALTLLLIAGLRLCSRESRARFARQKDVLASNEDAPVTAV